MAYLPETHALVANLSETHALGAHLSETHALGAHLPELKKSNDQQCVLQAQVRSAHTFYQGGRTVQAPPK